MLFFQLGTTVSGHLLVPLFFSGISRFSRFSHSHSKPIPLCPMKLGSGDFLEHLS
jgi:hypothetical protein